MTLSETLPGPKGFKIRYRRMPKKLGKLGSCFYKYISIQLPFTITITSYWLQGSLCLSLDLPLFLVNLCANFQSHHPWKDCTNKCGVFRFLVGFMGFELYCHTCFLFQTSHCRATETKNRPPPILRRSGAWRRMPEALNARHGWHAGHDSVRQQAGQAPENHHLKVQLNCGQGED